MKATLFAAAALGAMLAAGSASAMSLQNERAHDGGPKSFNGVAIGGQNLVLPYAATQSGADVTQSVIGKTSGSTGGFSLQNERKHDGRFN